MGFLYIEKQFNSKSSVILAEELLEFKKETIIHSICCLANSLLINPDKTKLLLLGTRQMLHKIPDAIHVTLLGK